jgi:hypothetical protein
VPDFTPSRYDKPIYTTTGLSQRVRLDLTGPGGRPGVDLRGYTVENHYREMSKGAYDLGSGNPADGNPLDTPVEDLSLGVEFVVRRVAGNNRWVVIGVRAARAENAP